MKNQPLPYRSNPIRFFVLFLSSMIVFGNQYAFNNPQALEDSLELQLKIGETQFQLFYTVFAFPNIFATFIIGFLIDFLGVRTGLITLTIGVTLSQLIIAFGGYLSSYGTILIGRGLFGLASQSLVTAQACLVSFWFKGRQLAFALGVAITFPELGNALNSYLSPLIYESTNSIGAPLMVSVLFCILSLACALGAAYLDRKADQEDKLNCIQQIQGVGQSDDEKGEHVNIRDVKMLQKQFWLMVILCMLAVSLYVPFMDGANRLYQIRFCFTQVTSGKALVITYLVASIFSAPLGYAIDKIGYKRYFIMAAFVIYLIAQIFILCYPQCSPIQQNGSVVGLIFLGLGYCFYGNCIIPTIPLIVKKKVTGTAFGIMQMIQSVALTFLPIISGSLVENAETKQKGYIQYSYFFVCIGFIGLLTSFGLFFIPENIKAMMDKGGAQTLKAVYQLNDKIIYTETELESQHFQVTQLYSSLNFVQLPIQQQLNKVQI